MPCGNWGATLSKAAYAAEKQAFLEQVRRRGFTEHRAKRTKRPPQQSMPMQMTTMADEEDAQLQLHQMQLELHMAGIGDLGHDFAPDVVNDGYYAGVQDYDLSHDDTTTAAAGQHDGNSNLFEINPRAAAPTTTTTTIHQQLQKLQNATREHDAVQARHELEQQQPSVFAGSPEVGVVAAVAAATEQDAGNMIESGDDSVEPYVPTMMTIDNLMNHHHGAGHAMRADQQQREAEEAAVVRARQTEIVQKRAQEIVES